MDRRWLIRLAQPLAGAAAVGLAASGSLGAADSSWTPPDCGTRALVQEARSRPARPADVAEAAWFTLDPLVGTDGTLAGQRLRVGLGRDRSRHLDLPPESTANGPFGRVVLVVTDDGRRSSVRGIDHASDCAWTIGTSADVIRHATLDPAGEAVYESRVDRRTRADLGVWRRPLDGRRPVQVAPPLAPDPGIGPTFSTTLGWSAEDDVLAIDACGAARCRLRAFRPGEGRLDMLTEPHRGELVGAAEGRAIGYAACLGIPCPLAATEIATRRHVPLAAAAGVARIVATEAGPRVAVETARGRIDVRRVDGTLERTLDVAPDLRPVPSGDRARGTGVEPPVGWLALSPDGRSPDAAVLVRLSDGETVELREVVR